MIERGWRIERTIPIVVVGGMFFQLVAAIVFASWIVSKFDSRLTDHDIELAELKKVEESHTTAIDIHGNRITRIEAQFHFPGLLK